MLVLPYSSITIIMYFKLTMKNNSVHYQYTHNIDHCFKSCFAHSYPGFINNDYYKYIMSIACSIGELEEEIEVSTAAQ